MKKAIVSAAILAAVLCCSGNLWSACPSADLSGDCKVDLEDFAIMASQWLTEGTPEPVIAWVTISETGFTGQMSKYETTNAQYCQFLNAAKASGDITVSGSTVYGANGSNSGTDFAGQVYYDLAGAGYTEIGRAHV